MELFSPEFFSALFAIVIIDLVLAGDNAIVIALAARNLPPDLRNKAIAWGTIGAIVVRSAMTIVVVWLLKIPGLLLAGGALLLWIAYKLLIDNNDDESHGISSATNFWGAMRTIVVADAVMGLDNVLAVAGAAHGSGARVFFSRPGFQVLAWFAFFAPAATPNAVVAQLNTAVARILGTAEIKSLWTSQGMGIVSGGPDAFAALVKSDYEKYGALIRSAGIKPE